MLDNLSSPRFIHYRVEHNAIHPILVLSALFSLFLVLFGFAVLA
jgi:hypothetical protein